MEIHLKIGESIDLMIEGVTYEITRLLVGFKIIKFDTNDNDEINVHVKAYDGIEIDGKEKGGR